MLLRLRAMAEILEDKGTVGGLGLAVPRKTKPK